MNRAEARRLTWYVVQAVLQGKSESADMFSSDDDENNMIHAELGRIAIEIRSRLKKAEEKREASEAPSNTL